MSVQEVGTNTVPKNLVEPTTLDIPLIVYTFRIHKRRKLFLKDRSEE